MIERLQNALSPIPPCRVVECGEKVFEDKGRSESERRHECAAAFSPCFFDEQGETGHRERDAEDMGKKIDGLFARGVFADIPGFRAEPHFTPDHA